ncbi:hypothetical protein FQA47_020328 [Oryzias melastigma]|uniref:Secreted protein n=1 Tax=Oryzias melastigma TaxID=30732 RepID=A0A834C1W3_ORYME|nr:hypothetical protein FQA47_020328 [Oryzias melastigma]
MAPQCALFLGACSWLQRGGAAWSGFTMWGSSRTCGITRPAERTCSPGNPSRGTNTRRCSWREGPQRIGSVYKKAMFREYTDASYTQLAPSS